MAGIDADGILRGKVMLKSKFLSACKDDAGFGFCSVIFGKAAGYLYVLNI